MSLTFINPIPLVKDIEVSRRFYADLLGLKILQAYPVFVLFENHFAIHQAQAYHSMAFGQETEAAARPP
jgi:catechol 2,3-dioxygenase-like lactoylglutathione lyase family enzyme